MSFQVASISLGRNMPDGRVKMALIGYLKIGIDLPEDMSVSTGFSQNKCNRDGLRLRSLLWRRRDTFDRYVALLLSHGLGSLIAVW